jgi:2-keto-4-pentenoate hydratase/2-oxohepta-3-ene-1,7-dioic acid hydratase in catechol pathway
MPTTRRITGEIPDDRLQVPMRFVTYFDNQTALPGVLRDDQIVPLQDAGFHNVLSIIEGGAEALARVRAALAGPAFPIAGVKLHAPIPRPPKIICVGLNYRDHAIESKMEIPAVPTIFTKFPTAVIGSGQAIVLPAKSTKPDYEAEFAFVIGKGGRHLSADSWKDHVFGYMNLNDVSARDYQLATTQWTIGKTFDTFAPMGPCLVTADEVADPHNLDISITVNDEVLQHSNTRELIFNIPTLIAYLSSVFTLEPGDIVSTGTPSGVGFSYDPPKWLKAGDDVVVRVEGLGELRNPVIAEN